jgi:hypothetical protein
VGIDTPLALDHQLRLSFQPSALPDPGTAFEDVTVVPRIIAPRALNLVVDELITLVQPFYTAAGGAFLNAELWKYTPFTFDAIWISAYDISEVGTGVIVAQLGGQSIFTYRTLEGGLFKLTTMESSHTQGPSAVYTDLSADNQALVDYFVEDDESWFLARDTSYPLLFLKLHPGQNERTFKRRFRD